VSGESAGYSDKLPDTGYNRQPGGHTGSQRDSRFTKAHRTNRYKSEFY